jgi:hypothetical protein
MTELEAVNQMLRSINEQPVQSLTSGQLDAEQAQSILDQTSREIQAEGWHANTRRSVSLTKNSDDQFAVGVNVLSVDSVNPDSPRRTGSPNPSGFYNVMLKRSEDDTKYILWDVDNDIETWASGPSTMTVDIIEFLRFEHLPPLLQAYIYRSAAHSFQKSAVASQVLFAFTQEDVDVSQARAVQEDMKNDDRNMFRHSRSSYEIVFRNNPMYNT